MTVLAVALMWASLHLQYRIYTQRIQATAEEVAQPPVRRSQSASS